MHLAPASEASSELAPEAVEMAKAVLYRVEPDAGAPRRLHDHDVDRPEARRRPRARRCATALEAYDKRHGLQGALKAPRRRVADKKGKARRRRATRSSPFEGTPAFEQHKVLVGVGRGRGRRGRDVRRARRAPRRAR